MAQLKKSIRKQSKVYLMQRAQAALDFNPSDKSAEEALLALQYPTKKEVK